MGRQPHNAGSARRTRAAAPLLILILPSLLVLTVLPACSSGEGPLSDWHAVMLSDLSRVTRGAGVWNESAVSVAANVVVATPEQIARFDSNAAGFAFSDVAVWSSEMGAPRIRLSSPMQSANADWNGSVYVLSGLVARPAYTTEGGTFEAVAEFADGTTGTARVAAPAAVGINDILGPPRGLDTELFFADLGFDMLFVYALAESTGGDTGVTRLVPLSELPLRDGMRRTTILDERMQASLAARGLTLATVNVALYNQADAGALFPNVASEIPLQAGRLFAIDAEQLFAD